MIRTLILSLCCVVFFSACQFREANVWHPKDPAKHQQPITHSGEHAPRTLSVVFAPVALGPLREVYPAARLIFAQDLAERMSLLGRKADAEGYVGEGLPDSDDTAWTRWPVSGAYEADFLVITKVLSITRSEELTASAGGMRITAEAMVEMRALDHLGNVVFNKRGRGNWTGTISPKFSGPPWAPETRTSWEGCSNAVGALLDFLERRNEATTDGPAPSAERMVDVEITSEPSGGDVLVDGVFRGNTPCTLKLPVHRLVLRIERIGYSAWERTMIPETGMPIRPVLNPLPAKPSAP
ncbi:MAG: PEGA domain-containing protein [Planctomycetota bacterium]